MKAKYSNSSFTLQQLYEEIKTARSDQPDAIDAIFKQYFPLSTLSALDSSFQSTLAKIADRIAQIRPITESGLLDGKRVVLEILSSNPEFLAVYWTFKLPERSAIVAKQLSSVNYCSLVPIIPAACKRYQNIPYSKWDPENLQFLIPKNLWEAMTTVVPEYTTEELLELRKLALTWASRGTYRKASSYVLSRTGNKEFDAIPLLARHMLLQTWCAAPIARTEYCVLDSRNWDKMPEPLISADNMLKPLKLELWD